MNKINGFQVPFLAGILALIEDRKCIESALIRIQSSQILESMSSMYSVYSMYTGMTHYYSPLNAIHFDPTDVKALSSIASTRAYLSNVADKPLESTTGTSELLVIRHS